MKENEVFVFRNIGEHNISLSLSNPSHHDQIAQITRALSNKQRLQILNILKDTILNVQEISQTLDMPLSTTAQHISILEEAGLVTSEFKPGVRGSMRLCACNMHSFVLQTYAANQRPCEKTISTEIPVGQYFAFDVQAPCGLADENGLIDGYDSQRAFYFPQRVNAQLLWFHQGYVEYRFPNLCNPALPLQEICFSMEICSEAPAYRDFWPSDITISVNGCELTTYTSPGDFGSRRGNLTPDIWPTGSTQYGLLKEFSVKKDGVYLGEHCVGNHITLADLNLCAQDHISLRIEIKEDAKNIGGLNLFGEKYGDYPQGIIMRLSY